MRARALVLGILSSTAVLAVGWQLGAHGQETATTATGTAASNGSSVTPEATTAPAAPGPTGVSGTFTGATARTRYGNVQVQVTVQNGTITDIAALHLTDQDSRSVSISNRAAPVLRQEVLSAQAANVQNVSGATYTTDGYLTSLQSALDQAGL